MATKPTGPTINGVIKASWRRTVSVKPYETETLELSVERPYEAKDQMDLVGAAQALDQDLARAGDMLLVERLEARAAELVKARPAKGPAAPVEPDEEDPLLK